jgi:hypothetical protein
MLQLQNNSPFVPFLNVLPDSDGVQTLQVVAKGTFSIFPEVEVAPVQVPACLEDQFWADPRGSSLRVASDVHLGKPSTDVVLVGQAWSSRGLVSELLVAVAVAERRKAVRVIGDRRWREGGTSFTRPEPFESMPLVYERASSAPRRGNHGRGTQPRRDRLRGATGFAGQPSSGQLAGQRLPNLEDPDRPCGGPAIGRPRRLRVRRTVVAAATTLPRHLDRHWARARPTSRFSAAPAEWLADQQRRIGSTG